MARTANIERSIGLVGATGIGIGAIVGGGILALAGVAFAATGASAVLAFVLNGVIAVITALTFAELATRFPESGGTYTFSRKVLSLEAAFTVGWVVWFASIVAAVLYALGFAAFAVLAVETVLRGLDLVVPAWIGHRWFMLVLAGGATAGYAVLLSIRSGSGGQVINIGKMLTFAVLIAGGLWALARGESPGLSEAMQPFFADGFVGLITAMGFTFIALQGFDLIAAAGGEVKNPHRTLPRAMMLSLGAALAVYVPLLVVVAMVGVPEGETLASVSEANPETIIAIAAREYLGPFGYWLVIVAAVLSMLSALQANLFAASRVSFAMARDHTLPQQLSRLSQRNIPFLAVAVSATSVLTILLIVPDVAAAGATASLIFLVSFALAHWMCILARARGGERDDVFQMRFFPALPIAGGLACLGLAVFQGVAVASAGVIGLVWLCIGGLLYLVLFARSARVVDAASEAHDPTLVRLRGRSPLVLVPVANPATASALVGVANALTPAQVGRVLLLTVIEPPHAESIEEDPHSLLQGQIVMREAVAASFSRQLHPEALMTIAPSPLPEIVRVARLHRCQCVLLGMTQLDEHFDASPLEDLLTRVGANVAILRAPQGWSLASVHRVLVPLGGGNPFDAFRARLLASLVRMHDDLSITYLRVVPPSATDREIAEAKRGLQRIGRSETRGDYEVSVERAGDFVAAVSNEASKHDLVILGLPRIGRKRRFFGDIALKVARETNVGILMLSRRS